MNSYLDVFLRGLRKTAIETRLSVAARHRALDGKGAYSSVFSFRIFLTQDLHNRQSVNSQA